MSLKTTIVIADDHAMVRDGLRQILEKQDDMIVVGEATDGFEAVIRVKETTPDILLLDIAMPNLNGLEAVKLIREATTDCRIVVVSMHSNESYVKQMLENDKKSVFRNQENNPAFFQIWIRNGVKTNTGIGKYNKME